MSRTVVVVAAATLLLSSCASDGDESTPTATTAPDGVATSAPTSPTTVVDQAPASTESTAAGSTTVAPAPSTSSLPSSTVPPPAPDFDFSAASAIVADFVAERGLNGAGLAVVDRDHGLIHHEHWGDFDEDRVSLIASSSKMISAGVLVALQEQGLLDIDAPVAEVVSWGAAHPAITPAQLVSNSSGLVGLLPDVAYAPYLCQWIGTDLGSCAEEIFTTAADDADVVPPDSEFRYGGGQWQVAGAVAEAASGKSWDQLIDEIYVQPCGLESLGYNNHFAQSIGFGYPEIVDGDVDALVPTDNPNIEGGAYVASGDYAELLLMYLRGGVCDDVRVFSEEAIDTLVADRILDVWGGSAGVAQAGGETGGDVGYGLGWWIDRGSGRRSDGGAYGSVPWLDLEDGYGVYLVLEADSTVGNELAGRLYSPIDEAMSAAT